jgi:2-keto-4-pentenoate hydratase/2-oxohepta-3-ene-1,7-dioic acid hydratase in catechol pathway
VKLVSFIDDDGHFAPGLLLENGDAIDLRGLGHDPAIVTMGDVLNGWDEISPLLLEIAGGGAAHDAPTIAASEVRLGPPVPRPTKLSAVGLNYRDHAAEANQALPEEPLMFVKHVTSVIGPDASIVLPPESKAVDYEAELAIVIGRAGYRVREEDALDHVVGYMAFNDVTARDWQRRQSQWISAKSFETFAPCGPWLVTTDEIRDPNVLAIGCTVNGEERQSSSTKEMVFSCAKIVSYISHVWRLEPGDVIATGTPPGIGAARKPPIFLADGDVVEVSVEGLGVLRNPVRAFA